MVDRFRAADTRILGISVDSVHSHASWARELGGVSFPLLADFHPKGAVAQSFGHYLADLGITDRATVIIDKAGVIRYSESVTPAGRRDIGALAAKCEELNQDQPAGRLAQAAEIPTGTTLYVKSACGHSRRARIALDNLHLTGQVVVANVTEDRAAADALAARGGKGQAPCLWLDGQAIYESANLIRVLADRVAPL